MVSDDSLAVAVRTVQTELQIHIQSTPSLSELSVYHSVPQRRRSPHLPLVVFLCVPAVTRPGLMNDLAGGGGCGCKGGSVYHRGW